MKKNIRDSGSSFFRSSAGGMTDLIRLSNPLWLTTDDSLFPSAIGEDDMAGRFVAFGSVLEALLLYRKAE
jgi:hypothetical protein